MRYGTLQLAAVLIVLVMSACTRPSPPTPFTDQEALVLLTSDRFDDFDRHYSAVQRSYKSGAVTDEGLRAAFRVFYSTDPTLGPKYDLWVAKYPRSYVAHLARGIYYKKVGLEQRGPQSIDSTTEEQLRGMEESFRKASLDLRDSYSLDDKPLLTYLHAINISVALGNRDECRRLLDLALKLDPSNVVVRIAYMDTLRVRWGGSIEELDAFVQESARTGLSREKLSALEAIVSEERGLEHSSDGDYAAAARDYRKAVDLGRTKCLPCLADALIKQGKYEEGIDVFWRALTSKPGDSAMLARRGDAYMKLGKVRQGITDLRDAAERGDAFSQNELGRLYMTGVPGVLIPDPHAGIEWFRKSAAPRDPSRCPESRYRVKASRGQRPSTMSLGPVRSGGADIAAARFVVTARSPYV